jgi:hypothetical protein
LILRYTHIINILYFCPLHYLHLYIIQITSFKFAVNAGSSYEGLSEKGASHLIATAAYSNTKKTSSIRLVRDLENIGAVFSSSADREKVSNNFIYLFIYLFIYIIYYFFIWIIHWFLFNLNKITYSLSVPTENAEKGFETVSQFFVLGPSHPYLVRYIFISYQLKF